MLIGLAIAAVLVLALRGRSTAAPQVGMTPPPPKSDVGDGIKTGAALISATVPLVGMLVAAGGSTAAGVGGSAAAGGATGAAAAANTGAQVGSQAGTTAVTVGTETVGLVVAEVTGVLIAVVWVGFVIAILQSVFETGQQQASRLDGAAEWIRFRLVDFERDLQEQLITKLGGQFTRHFDNSNLKYPVYVLDSVSNISPGKLAAIICIARYAAVEQCRAFNESLREGIKNANLRWSNQVWTDAQIAHLGYALSDSNFNAVVADFYAANAGATTFGTALRIEYVAPSGRTARRARLWSDDNALLNGRGVQEVHEFFGRQAALRYFLDNANLIGVSAIFMDPGNPGPDDSPAPNAGGFYASAVRDAMAWRANVKGEFICYPDAGLGFSPSAMRDYGGVSRLPLNSSGDISFTAALQQRNTN